jgi:hypothetical protein
LRLSGSPIVSPPPTAASQFTYKDHHVSLSIGIFNLFQTQQGPPLPPPKSETLPSNQYTAPCKTHNDNGALLSHPSGGYAAFSHQCNSRHIFGVYQSSYQHPYIAPEPRPQHVSPRIDRLIGSNRFLRRVLYGVEDGAASSPCSLTTTMTQQPSKVIKVRLETPRPRLMPNPRPEYVGASFHRLMARVTFYNSFFMASKGFSN